jgi:hypothetical protein
MHRFLKQYGERRSGTNYLRFLVQANFDDVTVLMHVLGDKHRAPSPFDALWRETRSAADPARDFVWRATFEPPWPPSLLPDRAGEGEVLRVAGPVATAFAAGEIGFLVSLKDPYAWARSVSTYLGLTRRPAEQRPRLLEQECGRFNLVYRAWLGLARERPSCLVRHEDLVRDPEAVLDAVGRRFDLRRKGSLLIDSRASMSKQFWDDIPITTTGTPFDRGYYRERRYLDELPDADREVVTAAIDWALLEPFGYAPLPSRPPRVQKVAPAPPARVWTSPAPPAGPPAEPMAGGTLESFRGRHAGEAVVVCGCGASLNTLERPERFVTIGVNDVGRRFHPDYLVVMTPPERFRDDRYHHVAETRARAVFSQLPLWLRHTEVVPFRLGRRGGTDPDEPGSLPYTRDSPYVAVALAVLMGARRIGVIGVDFTDHHFFAETGRHRRTGDLPTMDAEYARLYEACRARGVEVFNLSAESRLTAFPRLSLGDFASGATAAAAPRPSPPIASPPPPPVRGAAKFVAPPAPAPAAAPVPAIHPTPGPALRPGAQRIDDLTIVIPHGGEARLRNLCAVLERVRQAQVQDVIVVEMDERPVAREHVRAAGFRYVFAQQETTFHKTRAMNVAIPLVKTTRFLWLDSDILVTAAFLREALEEMEARQLDCLVPWTSVRYLTAADTLAVLAGTRDPAACTQGRLLNSQRGGCGGAVLLRTDFVKRCGGMWEEFHGWGREDGAFFQRAQVLGRAAATNRRDVHLYHVHHPEREAAYNPNYANNEALLRAFRQLRTPDALLARFPAPPHFTPPWLGTRRVACAPGAEEVGRTLAELYGPAVTLCGMDDDPDAVAQPDPSRTAYEVAVELACGLVPQTE